MRSAAASQPPTGRQDAGPAAQAGHRAGVAVAAPPAPVAGTEERQMLRSWLCGARALRPAQARVLLSRALEQQWLVGEPALQWRAVKAQLAGEANWADMGFRLVLH